MKISFAFLLRSWPVRGENTLKEVSKMGDGVVRLPLPGSPVGLLSPQTGSFWMEAGWLIARMITEGDLGFVSVME